MKKFALVLALVFGSALNANAAVNAGCLSEAWNVLGGYDNDSISPGCAALFVFGTTFAPIVFPAMTTTALLDTSDKEAYVNQLRDDSAEYVAQDGAAPASALLQDAIQQIRSKATGLQSSSNLEIAREILN